MHLATFTYASDMSLLGAALAAHPVAPQRTCDGLAGPHRSGSTARSGPTSGGSTTSGRRRPTGARGLSSAGSSPQDGTLVATVAQEGLIRPLRD